MTYIKYKLSWVTKASYDPNPNTISSIQCGPCNKLQKHIVNSSTGKRNSRETYYYFFINSVLLPFIGKKKKTLKWHGQQTPGPDPGIGAKASAAATQQLYKWNIRMITVWPFTYSIVNYLQYITAINKRKTSSIKVIADSQIFLLWLSLAINELPKMFKSLKEINW